MPNRDPPGDAPASNNALAGLWRLSRRTLLKSGLAAGALTALAPGALARAMLGDAHAPDRRRRGSRPTELRTYLFDFSWLDTHRHDLILVAGTRRIRLLDLSRGRGWRHGRRPLLRSLRHRHPVLETVPDDRITHAITAHLPAEGLQLCYVQRIRRTRHGKHKRGVPWDWVMQFHHVPTQNVRDAFERMRGRLGEGEELPVPAKWARLGLRSDDLLAFDDPVGLDAFKTTDDTACSMLAGHPELASGDATTHSYIQQQYIAGAPQTAQLGEIIQLQGPITPQETWNGCGSPIVLNASGYGTNVPVCDPNTGQQAVNSLGQLQYVPVYSQDTNEAAYSALTPALQQVKDDTTLGDNVTSNPDPTEGLIYRYQDGTTTSDQTVGLGLGNGLGYTTKDFSPGHGYSVSVTGVEASSAAGITATVSLSVTNWFCRYLGIYVRFLDGNGNTIPVAQISGDGQVAIENASTLASCCNSWDTDDDFIMELLDEEFEIFGIPTSRSDVTVQVPVPQEATSFLLLASGMGNTGTSNPYYGTITPGTIMTGIFDLALPTFFLALNAASGLAPMSQALRQSETLITILPLVLELFADTFEAIGFQDPAAFEGLGIGIAETLLDKGAASLDAFVAGFLAEGETEEDMLDSIPVIGLFLTMISAIGTISQMAQTSCQVSQSPSTYDFEVTLTHDVTVTVNPDPTDGGGGSPADANWPATATSFTVVLAFEGGTPTSLTTQLPPGTVTGPQTVTFQAVPLGGKVTASVQVNAPSGFQVGSATVGNVDNVLDLAITVTIKEAVVPLTASSVYTHKEVIALAADGSHVWNPTTTPPAQEAPGCTPSSGQLCQLTGITVNTTAGAVGQTFESANAAVTDCVSGSPGQLHQFSNISTSATPESEYFFSGCGFSQPPRLVYSLINQPDYNFYLDTTTTGQDFKGGVIRQVRLDQSSNPGFDGPSSNKAWGKLLLQSNAMLLHPAGKIISINTNASKFEVLTLTSQAVPDADAPIGQPYGGRGAREGLMNGPVLAALGVDGTVLVLEGQAGGNRIQAFDLNANPARKFGTAQVEYFFPLKDQAVTEYLDFAVEFSGYMYVLSRNDASGTPVYTLDIYDPQGSWLAATVGFDAERMAVSYFRDVYTQNFQVLRLPDGDLPERTEPAISHWIPSTP